MNAALSDREFDASGTDLSECRVLIVDDSPSFRKIIGAFLRTAGITHVEYACDGIEGLAKVDLFQPDLVILDIMMPKMDGFDVCLRLRADPRYRHLPILVQTALDSPSERTNVFQAGATDLITKPIHGPELIARIRVQLENRLLINSLEDYRRRMKSELELARHMQEALLPDFSGHAKNEIPGLTVASHFRPSAELGGDMWSLRNLGNGKVGVATVDFSGHGVSAALNTFRLHTLMHQMPPEEQSPSDYLSALNAQLVDLLPTHQFATMFFGIIDLPAGRLTYSGAGAPSPVVGNPQVQVLEAAGLPLGITRAATYQDRQVDFPPGSFLFLYSDALIETEDNRGNVLEAEDLTAMVSAGLRDGGDPLPGLLRQFGEGRQPPSDDLTLVWLRRAP